ncbi:MAG: hypothetical protein ACOZAR_01790 [Patescibacteria group bacterium]
MFKKMLVLFSSLFLIGCGANLPSSQATKNINSQINKVSIHVQQISDSNHVYDNSNINLDLLHDSKESIKNSLQQIFSDNKNSAVSSPDYQTILKKSLSCLHFIWLEEFDAAYKNNNQDALKKTRQEYNDFINQTEIREYYQSNNQTQNLDNLQTTFNEAISLIEKYKKINENKTKLSSLKQNMDKLSAENQLVSYNQLVDEYNLLVEENTLLVNEYNKKIEIYTPEKIYQSFLDLININDIFPQQNTLKFDKR